MFLKKNGVFFLKSCKSIWWNQQFILPLHSQLSNAEIAQLVEHNLAKVRVASSSLVFRSKQEGQCRDTLAFFIPCRESGIKNSQ